MALVKFAVTVGDTTEMVEVTGESGCYRLTIGSEVWEVDGWAGVGQVIRA